MLIRSNAAPSWDQYKIFPYWIIEDSTGGEESSTAVFESVSAESRIERWGEDRQRISLDKATLHHGPYRELRAFRRLVRGMGNPFLFRDIRECWMGYPNPHGLDLPPAKREWLGVGNGERTSFQLRIYEEVQGDEVIRNVYFPNHAYNQLVDSNNVVQAATERLRIWQDNTESFAWGVNRINSGVVTFDAPVPVGVNVYAFGSFYVLVRCTQDIIKAKPIGGGSYFELDGTEFIEPKGRK